VGKTAACFWTCAPNAFGAAIAAPEYSRKSRLDMCGHLLVDNIFLIYKLWHELTLDRKGG